jgi:hypothetical protein
MTFIDYIFSYLPDDEELADFMKDIVFPVL